MNRFRNNPQSFDDAVEETLPVGYFVHPFDSMFERQGVVSLQHNYINKNAGVICKRLLQTRNEDLSDVMFQRALDKVTKFVDCMGFDFDILQDDVVFDDIDEECINISFKRNRTMSLNLYYSEIDERRQVMEAFLCFESHGKPKIMNDSIPNIVEVIKQLIE